jgi:hypothetical protein
VTSAEIPYVVEIYDSVPVHGGPPREQFEGTFRCYFVLAGTSKMSDNAIITTYYPFFRVRIKIPVVRDISGKAVDRAPDQHLSRLTFEWNNLAAWTYVDAIRGSSGGSGGSGT